MQPSRWFRPWEALQSSAATKNRFLGFFKSSDRNDRRVYEKKITSAERGRKGLPENAIFFFKKYAFLQSVKKSSKKSKNSGFPIQIYFLNCGCSAVNPSRALIFIAAESQFHVLSNDRLRKSTNFLYKIGYFDKYDCIGRNFRRIFSPLHTSTTYVERHLVRKFRKNPPKIPRVAIFFSPISLNKFFRP